MFRLFCTASLFLLSATPALAEPSSGEESDAIVQPGTGEVVAPVLTQEVLTPIADKALARAVKIRKLEKKTVFASRPTSKDAVEEMLLKRFEEDNLDETYLKVGRMLRQMGVPGIDDEYGEQVRRVLKENVAGYYDWRSETLFVADWVAPEAQMMTLVHEITHALQDQHYDLGRFFEPLHGYSEPLVAIQALVEGDATLAMMLGAVPEGVSEELVLQGFQSQLSQSQAVDLAASAQEMGVPTFLMQQLYYPYLVGVSFCLELYRAGGWERVDLAYGGLPISSEQVLHPEKFLGEEKDDPVEVSFALPKRLEKAGWSTEYTDIFGEHGTQNLMRQFRGSDLADPAAAGWGGDRVSLLHREGPTGSQDAVLWVSEWDTPGEAAEAHALWMAVSTDTTIAEPRRPSLVWMKSGGQRLVLAWGVGTTRKEQKTLMKWLHSNSVSTTRMHSFEEYRKLSEQQPLGL